MMTKAKRGIHLGDPWYSRPRRVPKPEKANRHTARHEFENRKATFFPQLSQNVNGLPPAETDEQTVKNFAVSCSAAFKTTLHKSRSCDPKTFWPENHPEYHKEELANHRKRDRIVKYREAMLRVRNMMAGPKKTAKEE
jgi:hypothetical protein